MAATPLDYLQFNLYARRGITARPAQSSLASPFQATPVFETPSILIATAGAAGGAANNAANGGDNLLLAIHTLAALANVVIDLQAYTDILARTGMSFSRVKYIEFWHLSTADSATYGKTSTGVTIGNAAADGFAMHLGAQAHTIVLGNGDFTIWGTRNAAGLTVDATHKDVKILNNDATNQAAVQVLIAGGSS